MTNRLIRDRLLASTIMVSAAFAAPAIAQTAPAPADQSAPASNEAIVVTGSRISSPNLQSTSPITSLGAQELKLQGTTRVEDLVNSLPQAFVSQSSGVSNGSSGTATVNLRNLGDDRTLVLVDGHRLPPGDPSGGGSAADVNNIPSFLVKRIDVLTGGASATYGADAVAGVVNFIMDDNFQGFKLDVQGNINQHNNNNKFIESVIQGDPRYGNAGNPISYPHGNTVDGGTYDIGGAFGTKLGDSGHITVYGGYHHQAAVLQSSRDYSSCGLANGVYENGGPPPSTRFDDTFCSGSSNTAVTNFLPNAGAGSRIIVTPANGATPAGVRPFNGATDIYNFNPTNYYQRPDERFNFGGFANYDINDHFKPYMSFMFMDDHSVAQIAPSGTFNNVFTINCSNPLLSTSQASALGCTAPGAGSLQTVATAIAKRNVEGGGRQDDLRHTDFRIVGGMKGDIIDGFSYDVYGQYGTTIYSEHYLRDFSKSRVQSAINNCQNPDGSAVIDQTCVPYNIFTGTTSLQNSTAAGVTQGAIDYVSTPGFKSGYTREEVVSATIQGDLGTYGVKSPFASDGVTIAFGPEWRRETLHLDTDAEYATGDLLGQGGQTKSVAGQYSVAEGFFEAQIPVAQDLPGIHSLALDTAYRYSHYTSVGHTNTYKIGFDWSPLDGELEGLIRVRGSYNRAVRAPTVQDFFQPSQLGLGGSIDPCAQRSGGRASALDLQTCLLTAQSDPNFAAHFNNGTGIARNPASQYNSITAGAATAGSTLKPETAITKTIGVIIEPKRLLPGFSASIDYYDIKLKNRIGTDGYNTIINQCLNTGSSYYCGLIHRDPSNGSLWLTPNGYINDPIYNAGHLKTSGIDVSAAYNFDAWGHGRVSISFNGTYLLHNKTEVTLHNDDGTISSNGYYDCKGFYGDFCGVPNPTWRHKLRVTYSPTEAFSFSADWRHTGATNLDAANHDLDASGNPLIGYGQPTSDFKFSKIKAYDYLDLSVTFTANEHFSMRAGVTNVFDRDPAIIPGADLGAGNNNGNTYPGYYDALGRGFFLGGTLNF